MISTPLLVDMVVDLVVVGVCVCGRWWWWPRVSNASESAAVRVERAPRRPPSPALRVASPCRTARVAMLRAALRLRPNGFTSQLTPSKIASAAAPLANNIFVRNLCWARDDSPAPRPGDAEPRARAGGAAPRPRALRPVQERGDAQKRPHAVRHHRRSAAVCEHLGRNRRPDATARRTHFQRELLTLKVEGGISDFEGETCYMLPLDIRYEDLSSFKVEHVTFRRWPRDPERNPVKMPIPLIFVNSETLPAVKAGGYVHEMFLTGQGLKCTVRQREHIPRFLLADMRRSVDGDLRYEHLDVPPGVKPRKYKAGPYGRQLSGRRVKRVRG